MLAVNRLPGGARRDHLEELLAQIDIEGAAELQEQLGPAAWEDYTESAERRWEAATLPIVVEPWRNDARPDVIARFTALVMKNRESSLVSGFVAINERKTLLLTQITIEPELDLTRGITSETVREISLPEILRCVDYLITTRPESLDLLQRLGLGTVPAADRDLAHEAAVLGQQAERRQPGRPQRPDDLYKWVARTYLRLYRQGLRRGILVELAADASGRYGREIPRSTASEWVSGCRKHGYLEGGTQGKAGARPGPRLRPKR